MIFPCLLLVKKDALDVKDECCRANKNDIASCRNKEMIKLATKGKVYENKERHKGTNSRKTATD